MDARGAFGGHFLPLFMSFVTVHYLLPELDLLKRVSSSVSDEDFRCHSYECRVSVFVQKGNF